MRIYVASRFRNKPLVRSVSADLVAAGIFPVQTWTDEPDNCDIPRWQIATKDIVEITTVDALLVLTEGCELVPGGMHFEAGYAFGRNIPVVGVGPKVNIFYELLSVKWAESLSDAIVLLKGLR